MKTGQRIRLIRRSRGITQWQLSQAVGVQPGTILLIERGACECPEVLLERIADALGVSVNEIKDE